jgi:hypothetical protein
VAIDFVAIDFFDFDLPPSLEGEIRDKASAVLELV